MTISLASPRPPSTIAAAARMETSSDFNCSMAISRRPATPQSAIACRISDTARCSGLPYVFPSKRSFTTAFARSVFNCPKPRANALIARQSPPFEKSGPLDKSKNAASPNLAMAISTSAFKLVFPSTDRNDFKKERATGFFMPPSAVAISRSRFC